MKCPKCGRRSKVLYKKPSGYNCVERMRECTFCGFKFRTTEAPSKRDESLPEYINRMIYEVEHEV